MAEEVKAVKVHSLPKECNAEEYRKNMDIFKVVMMAKGNRVALKYNDHLPLVECDADDIEDTETDYKSKRKAIEKNLSVMTFLTILCLNNIRAKTALDASKTDDWPSGIAYKVIENLEKAFIDEDVTAKKLRLVLESIKYDDEAVKPDVFVNDIQRVINLNKEIKKKDDRIADKEFVEHIIENAPKVYIAALVAAEAKSTGTYSLDDASKTMYSIWKPMYGKDEEIMALEDIKSKDTEAALYVGAGTKPGTKFGGKCYGCGKTGHRKVDCPNKSSSNGEQGGRKGKRFNGTCHNCGKYGHRRDDCFELEKNASKRPANWRSQDTAMTATDTEYALSIKDSCSGICGKLLCKECICGERVVVAKSYADAVKSITVKDLERT